MLVLLNINVFLSLTVCTITKVQAANSNKSHKVEQAEEKVTISKGAAINIAKSEVIGKVLSADLIKSKGPAVYRIKVLVTDSRVRTVFVDGLSGNIIRIN